MIGRGVCDRCGLDFPHEELKREWTGVRVCDPCWEAKHPQLTPRTIKGPEPRPLPNARPEQPLTPPDPSTDIRTLWPSTSGGGN